MPLTAEQITVIRSSLDASGYQQGADQIVAANAKLAASGDQVTESQARVTRSLVDSGSGFETVRKKLDPAYASATAYAKTQDTITRAVQNGRASQDDANRLLELAAVKYATGGKAAEGFGGSTRATTMLIRETTRSFAEMAAGMNPLEIALLNIGHVEHAFDSFGSVAKSAFHFLTSGPAVVLEVVAAFATMAYVAETNQRALNDLSNRLAATRENFASLAPQVRQAAKELAATSTLTTPEASVLLTTVYSAPIFQGSTGQASDIARIFSNLNVELGETAADAKRLAEAFNEPSKVLQELTERHISGFTQALVNQAREFEAAGDKAAAMSLLLDRLRPVTQAVNDNLTPLQKAIHDMDAAFIKATGSGDGLVTTVGTNLNKGVAGAIEAIAGFITWIDRLTDYLGSKQADKALKDIQQNGLLMPWWSPLPTGAGNTRAPFPWSGPEMPGAAPAVGSVTTSSAGALGTMQLMPATAASLGVNPYDQSDNIRGGLLYIQQLAGMHTLGLGSPLRFPTEDAISRAYNVGPQGNLLAASGYAAKVAGADPSSLPSDVAGQIDYWGQVLGLPPNLVALGKRIAAVESGGQQFVPGAAVPPAPATVPADSNHGTAPPGTYSLGNDLQGTADAADKLFQSAVQFQRIDLEKQIEQFAKYRDSVGAGSDAGQRASAVIQDLRVKLSSLRDPLTEQEKIAQTARDAVAPLAAESGAARDLLTVYQRFAQLSRDTHQPIDQAALTSALADEQRKLSAAANDNVRQLTLQTAGQERLTPMLLKGGIAAELAANREKALTDARKTAVPGTAEYARQVVEETAALDRNTRAKADNAAAADASRLTRDNQLIQAEISLLGADTAERNRRLAVLQEEIKLGINEGDVLTEWQRKTLDLVAANADLKTALQQQQQDMNEVANAFSQSFDTIGQGIVTALVSGKGAAVNFQNVMTSVVEEILREFLKLSVLNPMLNSLFGGNRSTLSGVASAFSSSGSSGGSGFGAVGGSFLTGIGNWLSGFSFDGMASGSALADLSAQADTFVALGAAGLHRGGLVGDPNAPSFTRSVPATTFDGAPRYHTGLNSDEFAAILQRGERVLTAGQSQRLTAAMNGMGGRGGGNVTNVFHLPNVTNADSFRRSAPQIAQLLLAQQERSQRRNSA